jgi:DNA-binding protein HU-beta
VVRRVAEVPPVNKRELIVTLAKRNPKASKAQLVILVDAIFAGDGIIAGELRRGGSVQISGFGVFETRKRKERAGRNPRTGKEIRITASTAPVFRPGKGLKDAVNNKKR